MMRLTGIAREVLLWCVVGSIAAACAVPATAGQLRSAFDARTGHELLYVGDTSLGAIFVYRWPGNGKRIARISNVGEPGSIALDAQNNLYVANVPGHDVAIYPPGGSKPIRTVSKGLFYPGGVAVAADGTLYVSDYDGWMNIYEPKTYRLKRTVWLANAGEMGFDDRGYLYVMYLKDSGFHGVMRYPPHSFQGTTLPIDLTSAMAVDPTSGNIAASFYCCLSGGLALYVPPSYGGVADCSGGSSYSGQYASYLTFDPLRPYLFASLPQSSEQAAEIAVYSYQLVGSAYSCTFASSVQGDLNDPTGIAIGPDVGQWGKAE